MKRIAIYAVVLVGAVPSFARAQINLVGVGAFAGASPGSSLNCYLPAGGSAGDVAIAYLSMNGAPSTVTPPAGWTEIATQAVGNEKFWVFDIVRGASPPATTFTMDASTYASCYVIEYSGENQSAPIDQFASTSASSVTTLNSPQVTPSQSGDLLIVAFGENDGASSISHTATGSPTLSSEWEVTNQGAYATQWGGDLTLSSTAQTTAYTMTYSSGGQNAASIVVALAPGAPPTPTPTATVSPTPTVIPTPTPTADECEMVQGGPIETASADSITLAPEYSFAGNFLAVGVNLVYTSGAAPALSASDSVGNSWTPCVTATCAPTAVSGGMMQMYVCYTTDASTAVDQITITNSANNTVQMVAGLVEINGSSYMLDTVGNCMSADDANPAAGSVAMRYSNEFAFGACALAPESTLTVGGPSSPWVALNESISSPAAMLPAYAQPAAGTLSLSYTITPASPHICESFAIHCGTAIPIPAPTPEAAEDSVARPWSWFVGKRQ
ncbi:MAG TPA: hypothetical protein VMU16_15415 [Candidatus Binataceae bacterium]|nr:hypothetical protein [Candidatus Binataceae bacterium]